MTSDGRRLALATPHELSTQVGARVFAEGGNALDAALAAAASLTVTLPDNCALGGDLFALVHSPDGGVRVVNASGPAALAVDVERVRREHDGEMPSFASAAITVPGLIRGWEAIRDIGGTRHWSSILGSAATQARDGVPTAYSTATALARNAQRLQSDAGMAAVFFPGGVALAEGQTMCQPQLAKTLEELAASGARAFYGGATGESFLACLRAKGSVLSSHDLKEFRVEITKPLVGIYGGWEVLTAPPNSQGALLLRILADAEANRASDPQSHAAPSLASAFHSAAGARSRFLADPRMTRDLTGELLHGSAPGGPRDEDRSHAGDTVALVAADSDGWAVSLIQSLFDPFGCGILDPETGIIAHNRGSFFSLDPASPNVLAPGKRPAHTLTPVMIREDGNLRYVLGTMGGLVQTQVLAHLLLQLGLGHGIERAVGAPRWTVGGIDAHGAHAAIQAEDDVTETALRSLKQAGWEVSKLPARSLDVGEAVGLERLAGGGFEAAADPRGLGSGVVTQVAEG